MNDENEDDFKLVVDEIKSHDLLNISLNQSITIKNNSNTINILTKILQSNTNKKYFNLNIIQEIIFNINNITHSVYFIIILHH